MCANNAAYRCICRGIGGAANITTGENVVLKPMAPWWLEGVYVGFHYDYSWEKCGL